MIIRPSLAPILAAVALSACATVPNPTSPHPASGGAASEPSGSFGLARPAAQEDQETDYSPAAMFHEAHGEFYSGMDRFKPSARFRFRGLPDAEIHGNSGNFDSWQFGGEGLLPIVIDPDSLVLVGAKVDTVRLETSNTFGFRDETLHAIGVNVGFGQFFSDDTYVQGVFSPGVYSDLDGSLQSDDWQWMGNALATFREGEDLYWKVGVEVSQVFQDFSVYPLLGVSWILDPSWRVDVLLPRSAELSYLFDGATTLFVGTSLDGDQYRRRSSASTGKLQSNIQTQELEIYLGGIHRFTDHFSSFARFGAVVAGNWDFGRPGINNIDGRIEPTLMFEAGIGWDF